MTLGALCKAKSSFNSLNWAFVFTFSTADAFWAIDVGSTRDVHGANGLAMATVGAPSFVQRRLVETVF